MQMQKSDFDISTLDDELRVDLLCQELLRGYYESLVESGLAPERATLLANGADYFVRDFVVAVKQRNLFTERPGLVRQFAGNWYIVNTLEPVGDFLADTLRGVAGFYGFLQRQGLISAEFCQQVASECGDLAFYEGRIESFWAITGDGYQAWDRGCPLRDEREVNDG